MISMLCDNCETELRKNWRFCPTCGAEVIHEDIFINLGNMLKKITGEMEAEFLTDAKKPFGYGVKIDEVIDPDLAEYGEVYSKHNDETQKRTVEPKVSIKNLGNRILFNVNLPNADPDDVHLTELDESFEIRARARDKTYFKIITVPQGFSLAEQYFEKGKLILEFVT